MEQRKIAGNAAPLRRNLAKYLSRHPECEVYDGQDKDQSLISSGAIDPATGKKIESQRERVSIWNRVLNRKVCGNATPLLKNLEKFLKNHSDCEVYDGQDKRAGSAAHQNAITKTTSAAGTLQSDAFDTANDTEMAKRLGSSVRGKRVAPLVTLKSDFVENEGDEQGEPCVHHNGLNGEMSKWGLPMAGPCKSPSGKNTCKSHLFLDSEFNFDLTFEERQSSWSNLDHWPGMHMPKMLRTSTMAEFEDLDISSLLDKSPMDCDSDINPASCSETPNTKEGAVASDGGKGKTCDGAEIGQKDTGRCGINIPGRDETMGIAGLGHAPSDDDIMVLDGIWDGYMSSGNTDMENHGAEHFSPSQYLLLDEESVGGQTIGEQ